MDDDDDAQLSSSDPQADGLYHEGCRAAAEEKFDEAFQAWISAAYGNHPRAQRKVAFAFIAGVGTEKSDDLASTMMQRAAQSVTGKARNSNSKNNNPV